MDTVTLTAIIQGIIQIITIVGSIWAIFNKKTAQLEQNIESRIHLMEHKVSTQINAKRHTTDRLD